jgi:hypothetical protein
VAYTPSVIAPQHHGYRYSGCVINLLTLVITALAVMRVTRLVVLDQITNPIRMWIISKNGETGWFSYLIHCPICASVWIGGVAAPLYWFYGRNAWFLIPAIALAFSQLVIAVNRAEVL